MNKIKFVCPKCKAVDYIEEIQKDVVVSSRIFLEYEEDGKPFIDYRYDITCEDGNLVRYQCKGCGEILRNGDGTEIRHERNLINYLLKHHRDRKSEVIEILLENQEDYIENIKGMLHKYFESNPVNLKEWEDHFDGK